LFFSCRALSYATQIVRKRGLNNSGSLPVINSNQGSKRSEMLCYKTGTLQLLTFTVLILSTLCTDIIGGNLPNPMTEQQSIPTPSRQGTYHKRTRFSLAKNSEAIFGGGPIQNPGSGDPFSGATAYIGSEFPKGSQLQHIWYGSYLVGAIVGGDTLVSGNGPGGSNYEFYPDEAPFGNLRYRSTLNPKAPEFKDAISEEDYIAVVTDTFLSNELLGIGYDYFGHRPHIPLHIELTDRSYGWSYGYAEDFVIFDLSLKNIGESQLKEVYFGIVIKPEVGWVARNDIFIGDDDICGFLKEYPSSDGCGFIDTLKMAWSADNDGDPYNGEFIDSPPPYKSARNATGVCFMSLPSPDVTYSFNWWNTVYPNTPINYDFGPRHSDNYRDFHTGGLGWPEGDVNKYYVLRNGEIDYDMALTSKIRAFDPVWMYPDQNIAVDESDGHEHYFLLSVGPFDLSPGASIPIVFVVTAGENFHTDPNNLSNLYSGNVDAYYSNLDFSDLVKNANWANWIYDNPGVDTDGDGYKGEFRVCVFDSVLDADSNWIATAAETTWYKGDGVPDWKAAAPPPTPKMWVTPTFKGIHIRFNGQESETTKDIFTHLNDFEGYRVYISRDDREQSYSLLATYDIEDYDKYIWNEGKQPDPRWDLLDFPMTMQQIRCTYAGSCNDSLFDPLRYRPSQPFQLPNFPESLFYWVKHEWNVSEFEVTSDIKKRFPGARDPTKVPADSLTSNDYTDDGYLKFFEYEYTIENILPTVPYYVSVTAFDFGWPKSNLEPLETSITLNAQQVYPNLIDSAFGGDNKQVVVYPNPYRIDQKYRSRGFEGLGEEDRSNERLRRIHFANLPPKCVIRIFSLDGDLVREIHHDKSPSDPTSSNEEWGLVSRNGLAVVSGLYYWVVESDDGTTQMGKLAIIL